MSRHIGALEIVVAEVRAYRPGQCLPHGILALDFLHADDRAAAQILTDGRSPFFQLRLELGLIGRRPIAEIAVAVVGRVEQVFQVHGADRELLRADGGYGIHDVRRILDLDPHGIIDQQHIAAELIGQDAGQVVRENAVAGADIRQIDARSAGEVDHAAADREAADRLGRALLGEDALPVERTAAIDQRNFRVARRVAGDIAGRWAGYRAVEAERHAHPLERLVHAGRIGIRVGQWRHADGRRQFTTTCHAICGISVGFQPYDLGLVIVFLDAEVAQFHQVAGAQAARVGPTGVAKRVDALGGRWDRCPAPGFAG